MPRPLPQGGVRAKRDEETPVSEFCADWILAIVHRSATIHFQNVADSAAYSKPSRRASVARL